MSLSGLIDGFCLVYLELSMASDFSIICLHKEADNFVSGQTLFMRMVCH